MPCPLHATTAPLGRWMGARGRCYHAAGQLFEWLQNNMNSGINYKVETAQTPKRPLHSSKSSRKRIVCATTRCVCNTHKKGTSSTACTQTTQTAEKHRN